MLEHVDHPHLAPLSNPHIEGVTLDSLVQMGHIDMAQRLRWVMQLCDALVYLENRPRPYRPGGLTLHDLVVDAEGRLVLVRYDREAQPDDRLGHLLWSMLTDEVEFSNRRPPDMSADLFRVMRKFISGHTPRMADLQAELHLVAQPMVHTPAESPVQPGLPRSVPILGAVLALLLVASLWQGTRPVRVTHPALWVVCGDELIAFDRASREEVLRRTLRETGISDIRFSGDQMLLADASQDRMLVLNARTAEQMLDVRLAAQPDQILIAPATIYSVHRRGQRIGYIPRSDMQQVQSTLLPFPPGEACLSESFLFAAVLSKNLVLVLQDGKLRGAITVENPTSIAVSKDSRQLWTATSDGRLHLFRLDPDTAEVKSTATLEDMRVHRMVLSGDGARLYAVNDAGVVSIIATDTAAVAKTVPTGSRQAVSMCITQAPPTLYIAQRVPPSISIIDLKSETARGSIPLNMPPSVAAAN